MHLKGKIEHLRIFMHIYLLFRTDDRQIFIIIWCAIEYICMQYEATFLPIHTHGISEFMTERHAYIPIKLIRLLYNCV